MSISLLKSKEPANIHLFDGQKIKINKTDMERIWRENEDKNNTGK